MRAAETSFKYLFGALLLGAAANCLAVSLGPMRGATIVGRPFDVTLAAQLDASDGLPAVCVDADVFFGDSQLPPSRVRVVTAAGASAGEALIRIRTTSAVDEPVVTVYVREGCSQKNTRTYVVLAEVLADSASRAPVVGGEAITAAPLTVQLPATRDAGSKAGTAQAEPATTSARKKAARPEAGPSASVVAGGQPTGSVVSRLAPSSAHLAARAAPDPARKSSRARLRLDPLDLAAERDPVLRASPELLTMPSTDAQQRGAAAARWQALNAQPQDMLRDNQRLKSLETDVASMLAQSRQTQQAVVELKTQLEQARNERYNNWLVYALGALLLLALLATILLWTRGQQQNRESARRPWWRKELDVNSELDMPGSAAQYLEPEARPLKGSALGKAGSKPTASELKLDLDLDEFLFKNRKNTKTPQPVPRWVSLEPKDHPEFSPSLPGMPRNVNAEELFDMQQQANFFVSLGDFDKAAEVLRHHITDNVETSALAYLDLFDLYHRLGQRDDYESLRKDFNRAFNAQVPAFDAHTTDSQGLEFYASALSRIESLWPTPKVLEVIEETIFRKPEPSGEAFNLAAYRELLLLYAIAKEIVERPDELMAVGASRSSPSPAPDLSGLSPRVTGFATTNIHPLSAKLNDLPVLPFLSEIDFDLTQPPASPRLGLDIDLSRDFDDRPAPQPGFRNKAGEPLPDATCNLIEFDLDPLGPSRSRDK
ncbi:MAG: type IV pilus assembly protein FimV [Polaromonas sp.]